MLGQPPARRVDDDQTDNEKADTGKDLDTTLSASEATWPGGAMTRTRPNVYRP